MWNPASGKWQVGLRSKEGILTGTVADKGSTPRRKPISREATSPRSEEDSHGSQLKGPEGEHGGRAPWR